ncbi:hypothetical protein ACO0SA_004935 [Hanseniaspora valbyensis]
MFSLRQTIFKTRLNVFKPSKIITINNLNKSLYSTKKTFEFPKKEGDDKDKAIKKKQYSRLPLGMEVENKTNTEDDIEIAKKQAKRGPDFEFATWKGLVLLAVVGVSLFGFFKYEKKRLETVKEADSNRGKTSKGYGKPLIGGAFELIDTNKEKFTQDNLKGHWSLVYFGFTHCPDICPEELDQLGEWLDILKAKNYPDIQSIFITCDPNRDTPEVIKNYLEEFHEGIIGLTGTHEQVKHACKKYRVYFSTPKDVPKGEDYLVDHSIFFYLMDPQGEFVQALGRQYDGEAGAAKIMDHIDAYNDDVKNGTLLAGKDKRWYDKSVLEK